MINFILSERFADCVVSCQISVLEERSATVGFPAAPDGTEDDLEKVLVPKYSYPDSSPYLPTAHYCHPVTNMFLAVCCESEKV